MEKTKNSFINNIIRKLLRSNFLHKKSSLSISQDYYIFAAGIVLVVFLSSSWYVWKEKVAQVDSIEQQLALEAKLIDSEISNYFNYVAYIGEDRGHKIAEKGANNLENINYLLQHIFTFSRTGEGFKNKIFRWPSFSWANADGKITVISGKGILDAPVDVSKEENDYLFKSSKTPWQLQLAKPEYSVSADDMVIKAAIGVVGKDKQYIGSIITYFEVDKIIQKIQQSIDSNISFLILDKEMGIVMQSHNNVGKNELLPNQLAIPIGHIEDSEELSSTFEQLTRIKVRVEGVNILSRHIKYGNNLYVARRESDLYPFIILTGYNPNLSSNEFWLVTGKRVGIVFFSTFVMLIILFLFYKRLVRPIKHLAAAAKKIGKGENGVEIREEKNRYYPQEMHALRIGLLMTKRHMRRVKEASGALALSNKTLEERTFELEKVTRQLKYQQEVADTSKDAKEKFLGRVRHAVNKPLNTALGYTQQLFRRELGELPLGQKDALEYLTNILDSIAQTLTYTTSEIVLTHVKIEPLINSCIAILANDARTRKVTIETDICPDIPHVYISEIKIQQLITSLIFRGIEDTRDNGTIHISVKIETKVEKKQKLHNLIIVIKDNGRGFTEEERDEMRDKYAKDAPKPDENIRLTMSAMQHLVNLHHGSLSVSSTWNEGTTATLILPYRDEKEADKSPELKAEGVTYIDFKNKKRLDD